MGTLGTYGLRVPASRVGYALEAQGGLPPGPRVLYVRGTRTSHGRTGRTAYRGTPGACPVAIFLCYADTSVVRLQMGAPIKVRRSLG